ncbi:MAG: hypothetical protein SF002_15960 [Alphaproteobacteria bacterium]|nr:hypothetical protein [Alphaproteobacteria bacterium]
MIQLIPPEQPSWRDLPADGEIARYSAWLVECEQAMVPVGMLPPGRDAAVVVWGPGTPRRAPFIELLTAWEEARATAGQAIPPAGHYDPMRFLGALGHVLLVEREAGPPLDFRYRIYGSRTAVRAARDWTGQTIRDMGRELRSGVALFYLAAYEACRDRARPLYTVHESPPWLSDRMWVRQILPYAGADGRPQAFLTCVLALDAREEGITKPSLDRPAFGADGWF